MGGRRFVFAALPASIFACAVAIQAQAATGVQVISRTSSGAFASGLATDEGAGGGISGDGTIAGFASNAANLPQGNGSVYQSYVRDISTGKTRLASVNNQGIAAGTDTFSPAVSANGRFVAFFGPGNGLPGANGQNQVWVRDMQAGKTRLASAGPSGAAGTKSSSYPSLSSDGHLIAFESQAANLPAGDGTHLFVYIRDTTLSKTILASKTSGGAPASGQVYGQPLSGDGRYVAFYSNDLGLPHGNASVTHAYLRDRKTGQVRLIDVNNAGKVANGSSNDVSISANGRFVAFDSVATNLPGGPGPGTQSYVRDVQQGKTILVSRQQRRRSPERPGLLPASLGRRPLCHLRGGGEQPRRWRRIDRPDLRSRPSAGQDHAAQQGGERQSRQRLHRLPLHLTGRALGRVLQRRHEPRREPHAAERLSRRADRIAATGG